MSYKKRKRNFRIFIALLIVGGISFVIYFNNPSDERVYSKLQAMVEELNLDAPQYIDEYTMEDSLSAAPPKTLIYHISLLDYDADTTQSNRIDSTASLERSALLFDTTLYQLFVHEAIVENIRSNFRFSFAYTYRCDITYIYYDKNGRYVTSHTVTPNDYLYTKEEEKELKRVR